MQNPTVITETVHIHVIAVNVSMLLFINILNCLRIYLPTLFYFKQVNIHCSTAGICPLHAFAI